MNIKEIRQLAGWIREAGLSALELKRPGFELFIKRGSGNVSGAVPEVMGEPVSPSVVTTPHSIKAANPGVFFSCHPDERIGYIKVGDVVAAGQLLGLLRIGALYLPVRSDRSGKVLQILASEGDRVGYGQPLLNIEE
jgi:biotin carboxyl carrier protein